MDSIGWPFDSSDCLLFQLQCKHIFRFFYRKFVFWGQASFPAEIGQKYACIVTDMTQPLINIAYELYAIGLVNYRPSTNDLHHFVQKPIIRKKNHLTPVTWHLTHDMCANGFLPYGQGVYVTPSKPRALTKKRLCCCVILVDEAISVLTGSLVSASHSVLSIWSSLSSECLVLTQSPMPGPHSVLRWPIQIYYEVLIKQMCAPI